MNFKEAEEKIKKYYESLKVIGRLKCRLAAFEKRKRELEDKISSSAVCLNDNFAAVRYDEAASKIIGIKISPQEKALEKAFAVLERKLQDIYSEIIFIEDEISSIQAENADMEYILSNLKTEYKEIIDELYIYKRGTLGTSIKFNMDKSTVSRKKDKAVKEVMRWLNFYN